MILTIEMAEICPICLENIDNNNFERTNFCNCSAKYHTQCLSNHYNLYHNCPTCRKNQHHNICIDNTNNINISPTPSPNDVDQTRGSNNINQQSGKNILEAIYFLFMILVLLTLIAVSIISFIVK